MTKMEEKEASLFTEKHAVKCDVTRGLQGHAHKYVEAQGGKRSSILKKARMKING